MSQSYNAEIDPEVCPTAGDVIQNTLDAASDLLAGLDPVETIIALVALQLFVEVHKSTMSEDMLAAYRETLEGSCATTFPIIEEDDGEE